MKAITRLVKELKAKWGVRAARRRSADRAAQVACRVVLNGCRL